MKAIVFSQRGDKVMADEPWPAEAAFTWELLRSSLRPEPGAMRGIAVVVNLYTDNGRASYLIGAFEDPHIVRGRLIPDSEWRPPDA